MNMAVAALLHSERLELKFIKTFISSVLMNALIMLYNRKLEVHKIT